LHALLLSVSVFVVNLLVGARVVKMLQYHYNGAIHSHLRRFSIVALMSTALVPLAQAAIPGQPIAIHDLSLTASRFPEPLIPTKPTSAQEDAALNSAAAQFQASGVKLNYAVLENFVVTHPNSGWNLAVLTNLGIFYATEGYYTKAQDSFERAYTAQSGISLKESHTRALADRAAGELLRIHAQFGHIDRVATLLQQLHGRGLSGPATEMYDDAIEITARVRKHPETTLICGEIALKSYLLAQGAKPRDVAFLNSTKAGPHGTSLAELQHLASHAQVATTIVFRKPSQSVPVPSIVHWKINHFSTILRQQDGRFLISDPTRQSTRWITQGALDSESSGYFLTSSKNSTLALRIVDPAEANTLMGASQVGSPFTPGATGPGDLGAQGGSPGSPGKPGSLGAPGAPGAAGPQAGTGSGGNGGGCDCNQGMTGYSFTEMAVSLRLNDAPVGYVPPIGPSMQVSITYNQREAGQPSNFSFFNISPKWTLNWLSFITDTPGITNGNVQREMAGGGFVAETFNTTTNTYAPENYDGAILTQTSSASYKLTRPNGQIEIYAASNGATSGTRLIFLSEIIDPKGQAATLAYDSQMRLTTITDATGRQTAFSYNVSGQPLLVSSITDPFGRSASLSYDSNNRLQSITDVLGIVSQYGYDSSNLVNQLTTPYGTTNFSYGQLPSSACSGNGDTSRYVQATDPLSQSERLEFCEWAPGIAVSDAQVPTGLIQPVNGLMQDRDTFYWDKHAYVSAGCTVNGGCDYLQARNRHWAYLAINGGMDNNPPTLSNSLESEIFRYKNSAGTDVAESRIWYSYPGQLPNLVSGQAGFGSGSVLTPSVISRLVTGGASQVTNIGYNSLGNRTSFQDPAGRQTIYNYAANNIDINSVQAGATSVQAGATSLATIAQFAGYNSQHLPQTYTDAAGQITQYTYNTAGQIASIADPLGHSITFNYTPSTGGDLTSIVKGSSSPAYLTYTYDAYDRIATSTDSDGWVVEVVPIPWTGNGAG